MNKNVPLFLLFFLLNYYGNYAQQPVSPLISSFEQYKQKKALTTLGLEWIQLGPTINSARVESVQVDPDQPEVMYAAFGSGNLWKTTNNGLTWKPIFENQPSLGIGDIALAPSDPNIIYLGTGESLKKPRNFTMPGTGVYRSNNGGETWKHLGLNDSWHIGEIAVHPENPNIVYVAVLGHFWTTNPNRGIYRSINGGTTWEHVLYINDSTGGNDIVISPTNPNVIYASMWENFPGVNGKNSGVYKSDDGGKTWSKCTKGLPADSGVGRIGLAVSQTNAEKVYAFMDHREKVEGTGAAEIYRSVDGGLSWTKTHTEELMFLSVIGWYFTDIYTNPLDDEEIFALGVRIAHSKDGGKTFSYIGGEVNHLFPSKADPLHLDHCELWINPSNPNHLALGNDGGFYVSYDKGATWTHYNNIPAGEFYDITLDYKDPYTIYGGTQDDATVFGKANEWIPEFFDGWKYLWIDPWSGGDGCITLVDPIDSTTIYFSSQEGGVRRMNLLTNRSKGIRPRLGEDAPELNYNFISPYILSPHDNKTLYMGANYVLKSTNRGDDWAIISKDLSKSENANKNGLAAGAIAESPLKEGSIFLGTDKGAFWVSEDGGETWEERSGELPDNYIRCITPSRYKESRVYVTLSGMNYDDLDAYVFVSENYGKTWTPLVSDLPNEIAYTIKEDPVYESILYAGMYRGAYVSFDMGKSWELLGKNLPPLSVADIEIDEQSKDLVLGTHGRGMYKVNLSPIHEAFQQKVNSNHVFNIPSIKAPEFIFDQNGIDYRTIEKVPITFWSDSNGNASLEILNNENESVWINEVEIFKGFNQFRWNLVLKNNESPLPYYTQYNEFIRPGEYTMKITMNGSIHSRKFIVK